MVQQVQKDIGKAQKEDRAPAKAVFQQRPCEVAGGENQPVRRVRHIQRAGDDEVILAHLRESWERQILKFFFQTALLDSCARPDQKEKQGEREEWRERQE